MEEKENKGSSGSKEKKTTAKEADSLSPSGVPLLFVILCGLGLLLLCMGALVSNLTLQTEAEPDLDQQKESNEGYQQGLVLYNFGLFTLSCALFGAAFFSEDLRWELRMAFVLTAGIVLGFGGFRL